MTQSRILVVLLATFSLALVACNETQSKTAASATPAATVNGEVISEAEIQLKGRMHTVTPGMKHPISEQALQSIVNLELLRQAALDSKLDADESTRAKLAISKRAILATAYMEKVLAEVAEPTAAEVSAYYDQHSERYANRKRLTLHEVVIPQTDMNAEIEAEVGKVGKFADFEKWLRAKNIGFTGGPVTNTTDLIPEETLQKLKDVPVGGTMAMKSPEGTHVLFVLDAQPMPITLEQASQAITNSLLEKGKQQAMDDMIKALRDKAEIKYLSPYTESGYMPPIKDVE